MCNIVHYTLHIWCFCSVISLIFNSIYLSFGSVQCPDTFIFQAYDRFANIICEIFGRVFRKKGPHCTSCIFMYIYRLCSILNVMYHGTLSLTAMHQTCERKTTSSFHLSHFYHHHHLFLYRYTIHSYLYDYLMHVKRHGEIIISSVSRLAMTHPRHERACFLFFPQIWEKKTRIIANFWLDFSLDNEKLVCWQANIS